MLDYSANLRRLMARFGMTVDEVVDRVGLDERTVKSILAGRQRPHARTLNRLANGLGVSADELFQDPSLLVHRIFDRRTNPLIDQVVADHRGLFRGWTEADFDELYSRFGTGGGLTRDGALAAVQQMNRNRRVHRQVALLLESGQAELLADFVKLLYDKVVVREEETPHGTQPALS